MVGASDDVDPTALSETDLEVFTVETAREVSLLAVAHAAIDPNRRAIQGDILVDSVLRVLAGRGLPMKTAVITGDVAKLWRTTVITELLVSNALDSAKAAQLVTTQDTNDGGKQWVLADSAIRELNEDSSWAQAVLDRFDREAMDRLNEDPDRSFIKVERLSWLIGCVRQALAVGSEGLHIHISTLTPWTLRPPNFNVFAARNTLSNIQPKPVRRAAERLLLFAIDPDNPFGDEYLDLVITGMILHGMLTRRDVAKPVDLHRLRLVFDTSVIVGLAYPGSEEARAVEEGINLAKMLDAEVVVAEHTLAEWTRLFDGAEQERRGSADRPVGFGTHRAMFLNPFHRAYSSLSERDNNLSWARYSNKWRDPRNELEKFGIRIISHGNDSDRDQWIVAQMADELRKLNLAIDEGQRFGRKRSIGAIDADSNTAAMVSRWRMEHGVDSGFFVAHDRMSADAYRTVVDEDHIPLVLSLRAWIALAAVITTEDPAKRTEVAKIIGNSALRDSFLSLAAAYTYEEVASFADTLSSDDEPEPEDVVDFVQTMLDDFENSTSLPGPAEIRIKGAEVLRSRVSRRNQRARRAIQMVDETVLLVATKAEDEKTLALAAIDASTSAKLASKDAELVKANDENKNLRYREAQFKRAGIAGVVLVTLVLVVILGWRNGLLDPGRIKVQAVITLIFVGMTAIKFVRDPNLANTFKFLGYSIVFPILVNLWSK